jgi:hypothetical protein
MPRRAVAYPSLESSSDSAASHAIPVSCEVINDSVSRVSLLCPEVEEDGPA